MTLIIYRKNHKRQPVRFGHLPFIRDMQGDIPAGWCSICGCEVFEYDNDKCILCRSMKGEKRE